MIDIDQSLCKENPIFRVVMFEKQSLIGFPKLKTYYIKFELEQDKDTYLPYNFTASQIYEHISLNRWYTEITRGACEEVKFCRRNSLVKRFE